MAGIDQKQLAQRINTPKLGFKNIGKIERGERNLEPHEASLFAEALGVPPSFFYERKLPPARPNGNGPNADPMLSLERRLTGIEVRLDQMEAVRSRAFGDVMALLEHLADQLDRLLNPPAAPTADTGFDPEDVEDFRQVIDEQLDDDTEEPPDEEQQHGG